MGCSRCSEEEVSEPIQKGSYDPWGSETPCTKRSVCLKWFYATRQFHRAQFKRGKKRDHRSHILPLEIRRSLDRQRFHKVQKTKSRENRLLVSIKPLQQPSYDDLMISKGKRYIFLAIMSSYRN